MLQRSKNGYANTDACKSNTNQANFSAFLLFVSFSVKYAPTTLTFYNSMNCSV